MAIRALYVTSEVYPLAKTGGLADVSAALPAALREVGIDVRLVVPAYPQALNQAPNLRVVAKLGGVSGYGDGRLLETVLQGSRVPVWLVDHPASTIATAGSIRPMTARSGATIRGALPR